MLWYTHDAVLNREFLRTFVAHDRMTYYYLTYYHCVNDSVAALVVVDQPFPMVVTKSKQLDDDPLVITDSRTSNNSHKMHYRYACSSYSFLQ